VSAAPAVDSFDLCFELAAVLAELTLNLQAVGQAAAAPVDPAKLSTALWDALQLQAEARAALARFHQWADSEGAT